MICRKTEKNWVVTSKNTALFKYFETFHAAELNGHLEQHQKQVFIIPEEDLFD